MLLSCVENFLCGLKNNYILLTLLKKKKATIATNLMQRLLVFVKRLRWVSMIFFEPSIKDFGEEGAGGKEWVDEMHNHNKKWLVLISCYLNYRL